MQYLTQNDKSDPSQYWKDDETIGIITPKRDEL